MNTHSIKVPIQPAAGFKKLVTGRVMQLALTKNANKQPQSNVAKQKPQQLIRTVAHDLRNPLGGISSLVDVIMEDGHLNAEQRDLLNLVKETAHYSLNLVNDLLENNGMPAPEKQPTDIAAIISACVTILQHKAAEKDLKLLINLPSDTEMPTVSPDAITRVVDSLLSNAIKFTQAGGTVTVKATQCDGGCKIIVQDNGIGIPVEMQANLFNGNPSAGRTGTAGEQSFGMGLPICKQIVDENYGRIWFESAEGQGTTFYAAFPIAARQINNMVA